MERTRRLANSGEVSSQHLVGFFKDECTCGNFSDTSSFEFRRSKGSLGHAFTVRIRTGNQNQTSFYPSVPHEISVLVELILGHLRYLLTDVPPQPNSPPDNVFRPDRPAERALGPKRGAVPRFRFTE
ncbi:Regulator of rDNA transcription protein 15 [Capsicum baccatum]|uniref:Regulator of rDNA transcription protein 15 n=1 Tax=Capsicum baccatum TaxID=33114 RepID=A0A2G2UZQ1_CAPBA|nr:Regulator of rDNA transcription protein 15 [Capsicum baccatum]